MAEPTIFAFVQRQSEPDVSVNHMEFYLGYVAKSRTEAISYIRREMKGYPFKVTKCGRFLVINVSAIKAVALEECYDIDIIFTPEPAKPPKGAKPSHSSIFGLPIELVDEVGAAADMLRAILSCLTADDIHTGCPSDSA